MNTNPPFIHPFTFTHLQDPKDERIKHLEQENQKLLNTLETLSEKYMALIEQHHQHTPAPAPPPPKKKLHVIRRPNQATILTTKKTRPQP